MKKIASLLIIAFSIYSCSSDNTATSESSLVTNFLEDISSLEDNVAKGKNPIADFITEASNSADKTIEFSKENLSDVLEEAKAYKHQVITTGDHTIIKITDLDDCKQSSSWGACVPFAKGYIKKGDLVEQADYMNNIVGRPDDQKRLLFLFN